MRAVVVVGTQWGDEGKGKVTDYLAEQADMIVRYQGGANAGHTVVFKGQEYKLHLVPSGIFHPGKICVLAGGMVIDPVELCGELDELEKQGHDIAGLRVSYTAHLVLPYHKLLDGAEEVQRGANKIGTTQRGIGPAYVDKYARTGLRIVDLFDEAGLREKLKGLIDAKNRVLECVYGVKPISMNEVMSGLQRAAVRLKPFVCDASRLINEYIDAGRKVLLEGAQGTMLDIDHGTYPYVTASNPTAGGACTGSGIGPTKIKSVVGVVKAYSTRVGDGPLLTELKDETGVFIRERGHEYGATTGRPRRVGWLDLVIVKYASRVNGLTSLALTKLDTLAGLETVKVCIAYKKGSERLSDISFNLGEYGEYEPCYVEMKGWDESITVARSYDELPKEVREYIRLIENVTGTQVSLVSVGRDRGSTFALADVFA
ncbi:MAG TPA: adenylosuccinate synthase [Firmicutes bacterium]|nr:adenylosuccinate synthase [Bacillota bacterium]